MTKPVVVVYGDSLPAMSADACNFFYGAVNIYVFRVWGGTAPCDWVPYAASDRAKYHPSRVVISFTGNVTLCASGVYGIPGWLESYRQAIVNFHSVYAGIPIKILGAPACDDFDPNRPHVLGLPALNALYRDLSAGGTHPLSGVTYDSGADDGLTPGHVFRMNGPVFMGTKVVPLRTADHIHLTSDGQVIYGVALGG